MTEDIGARHAPTGDVVHDINNRLTAIIGTVDVLLTQVDAGSEIGDGLQEVLAAALKIQELARQIPRCQTA